MAWIASVGGTEDQFKTYWEGLNDETKEVRDSFPANLLS